LDSDPRADTKRLVDQWLRRPPDHMGESLSMSAEFTFPIKHYLNLLNLKKFINLISNN